jgi:hypothetical protein
MLATLATNLSMPYKILPIEQVVTAIETIIIRALPKDCIANVTINEHSPDRKSCALSIKNGSIEGLLCFWETGDGALSMADFSTDLMLDENCDFASYEDLVAKLDSVAQIVMGKQTT